MRVCDQLDWESGGPTRGVHIGKFLSTLIMLFCN